jgi:hypothetical protein
MKTAVSNAPQESSPQAVRHLTLLVVMGVGAAIALANVSSEPVSAEIIKRIADAPQRAYGWPVIWYWRVATTVPGEINPWGASTPRPVLQWSLARYRVSSLVANSAIWLVLLVAAAASCQRLLMEFRRRMRWRPRVTTFIVLLAVALPTVLANMTFETSPISSPRWYEHGATARACFGWPLLWNWYFVAPWDNLYGWDFSAPRLVGNLVIWLGTLAAVALVWEWLMRRYRPRLSFSLRTMFIAVVLASVLCAWCAAVWRRANEQDALAELDINNIRVNRSGPKWFGLVVPDRYRRCVVDVSISVGRPLWLVGDMKAAEIDEHDRARDDERGSVDDGDRADDFGEINPEEMDREDEELLTRLARLSTLRAISINCGVLTPAMAETLSNLWQLRTLQLWLDHACGTRVDISWIGRLRQLAGLRLDGVQSEQLASLIGLSQLKSLTLDLSDCEDDEPEMEKRLAIIGNLMQLRRLHLEGCPGTQISRLRGLTNLKSLTLDFNESSGDEERVRKCFEALGKLTQLEQLWLAGGRNNWGGREGLTIHADDLECLRGLNNLKSLRLEISCEESERHACLATIGKLTQLRRVWLEGDLVSTGLEELASLESLEELTSDNRMATTAALRSLSALKRLRAIHIAGLEMDLAAHDSSGPFAPRSDPESLRRAVESLRQSHPRIVIDGDYSSRWAAGEWEEFTSLTSEPFDNKSADLDSFLGLVPMGP